ncbi:MAG: nucleotidyltransferase domain-containing protein [Bacillota bacterium]
MEKKCSLDLSILSKELRLLLEIIKTESSTSDASFNSELFKDLDWELFLQLVRHHRVYPLIYSKLKNINEKLVPPNIIRILSQEYKKNTFQMLHLSGEMGQVSKLFIESKIRLLFVKGPVIADDIYGDISLRTSKDLDILISKSDLKRADELLLDLGYEREEIPGLFDVWKWWNHHISYIHPQKRIQIEIHWRLHPPPMKEPSFNELWERRRESSLTSYPVYFFGKEDLFLYLVFHGVRHGWFRLRWLADIDQIIRNKNISEESNLLLKEFQHKHLGKQAYPLINQTLILASQLLKTPIPDETYLLTKERRSRKLARLSILYIMEMGHLQMNQIKDSSSNYLRYLRLLINSNLKRFIYVNLYKFSIKSNVHKLIFFIQMLLPSSEDAKTLRLPKPLHFLYFPLHPFLWVWRKTRKPV